MSTSLLEQLRARVSAGAENRPGVYRFLGPSGEVLYVGKSIRVRTRLLSYFRAKRGEKAAEIAGHAHHVEWDYVPSEFASLLLEFRLIKRYRPPYNVEHKHDRSLCFLKLSREAVPRLVVVGLPGSDGAEYYGPLRGRTFVSHAVKVVSDLLELRDCASDTPMRLADQFQLFDVQQDPLCMRGPLGRCLAPCAGGCTKAEYQARAEEARAFLEGRSAKPLDMLRERIATAARRLQFEYAAELRDRLEALERLQFDVSDVARAVRDLSFLYTVPGHGGEDRVYVVRRGSVRAELPAPRGARERKALEAQAEELFSRPEPQTLGLRAHEAQEVLLVARWFRLHPDEHAHTTPAPDAAGAAASAQLLPEAAEAEDAGLQEVGEAREERAEG
jgi:excinuclease ABC subunit C